MTTLVIAVVGFVILGLVPAIWWAVPSAMDSLARIADALEQLVDLKKRGR